MTFGAFLQRLLIVPPELAYGKRGIQEIPPNATIQVSSLLTLKAMHTVSNQAH